MSLVDGTDIPVHLVTFDVNSMYELTSDMGCETVTTSSAVTSANIHVARSRQLLAERETFETADSLIRYEGDVEDVKLGLTELTYSPPTRSD